MPGYKYFEDYTVGQKQVTSGRTMTEADIGIGEKIVDLQKFNADQFVNALFETSRSE